MRRAAVRRLMTMLRSNFDLLLLWRWVFFTRVLLWAVAVIMLDSGVLTFLGGIALSEKSS